MPAYPPAPWHLAGELTLVPVVVPAAAARRFRTPGELRSVAGRTLGGVMLVNYRSGTLIYNELIVFSGLATDGKRPGFIVSHIYAAPALVKLEIPDASPFAVLGDAGTRPGIAGDFALTMRAPS